MNSDLILMKEFLFMNNGVNKKMRFLFLTLLLGTSGAYSAETKLVPSGPTYLRVPVTNIKGEVTDYPNVGKANCEKVDLSLRAFFMVNENMIQKHCRTPDSPICKTLVSQLNQIRYASFIDPETRLMITSGHQYFQYSEQINLNEVRSESVESASNREIPLYAIQNAKDIRVLSLNEVKISPIPGKESWIEKMNTLGLNEATQVIATVQNSNQNLFKTIGLEVACDLKFKRAVTTGSFSAIATRPVDRPVSLKPLWEVYEKLARAENSEGNASFRRGAKAGFHLVTFYGSQRAMGEKLPPETFIDQSLNLLYESDVFKLKEFGDIDEMNRIFFPYETDAFSLTLPGVYE
jgi:hypothetical protein